MPPKKGQKKCDSCGVFFSVLDPHPSCSKCGLRLCSKGNPCKSCASLSPEGWKLWDDLRAKSRANYKKQVRASTKGKGGKGASSTITRDPPSRPPKLGGNPSTSKSNFDALSNKVDTLASGMETLMKMMLEKEQSSSKRSNGIPHVLSHEGNVAQTPVNVASEANLIALSPTRVGDMLDNTGSLDPTFGLVTTISGTGMASQANTMTSRSGVGSHSGSIPFTRTSGVFTPPVVQGFGDHGSSFLYPTPGTSGQTMFGQIRPGTPCTSTKVSRERVDSVAI